MMQKTLIEKLNLSRPQHGKQTVSTAERWGVPQPAYRPLGFSARTQSPRLSDQSGLLNLKKQRGTAQVPQPLVSPLSASSEQATKTLSHWQHSGS